MSMRPGARAIAFVAAALFALPAETSAAESPSPSAALTAALKGSHRSAAFVARDAFRHPAEELAFFGLRPNMSVVEIWPGGGYWTEILAPVLHDSGRYEAAVDPRDAKSSPSPFERKLAGNPAVYGKIKTEVVGEGHTHIAPPNSVDLVVTFRNVHNWIADGYAPEMFVGFFKALKHGGILGVEEHRGNRAVAQDPRAADGYVNQATIVALATAAGFVLDASSEMNANPRDTANWPRGVWTLPPTLDLGDTDKAKYVAVGEADNAVLRFRKP